MKPEAFSGKIELIDSLLRRASQHRRSEKHEEFIEFISRFRHYSFFNATLVYIQNPKVSFFGTDSFWKNKFKRKVNPDAKPYIILMPGGPIGFVYDVFETNGEESAYDFINLGAYKYIYETKGHLSERVYNLIIEETQNWSISVYYKVFSFFKAGYVQDKNSRLKIFLKEHETQKNNFATLTHELAHIFLGHLGDRELSNRKKDKVLRIGKRDLTIQARELEAETVSFLVCNKLNLEPNSHTYIASYIDKDEVFDNISYAEIIKCADKIIKLFLP